MVAKQPPFHHPMLPVPGTPRFRPAPPPADFVGHGGVSTPAAAFALSSPAFLPPPGAYSTADPRIFRVNGRPYWVHGLLGRGGYGEVCAVEMLLPDGLEVAFSENGDIEIDNEDGCLVLRPKQMVSEREPQETGRLPPAVDSSFPHPPSWSTFGDASLASEESTTHDDLVQEPHGEDHGQTIASVPTSPTEHFVYSSGVFLALKTQCAQNAKVLGLLVKEVENLRFLKGNQGVVQIIDYAVDYEFLKLYILMELGVAFFCGGENLTMLWMFLVPCILSIPFLLLLKKRCRVEISCDETTRVRKT